MPFGLWLLASVLPSVTGVAVAADLLTALPSRVDVFSTMGVAAGNAVEATGVAIREDGIDLVDDDDDDDLIGVVLLLIGVRESDGVVG